MLKGFFRIGNVTLNMIGRDNLYNYEFNVWCDNKDAQAKLDKGLHYTNTLGLETHEPAFTLWNKSKPMYIRILESEMELSRYEPLDKVKGTKNYNEINTKVFKSLGGLLFGLRKLCTEENNITYDDLFGIDKTPDTIQRYEIRDIVMPQKKGTVYKYVAIVDRKLLKINSVKMGTESTPYQLELYTTSEDVPITKPTKRVHKLEYPLSMFPVLKYKPPVEPSSEVKNTLLTWDEIQARYPTRNYKWLHERDYRIVYEPKEVEEVVEYLKNHDGIISFDTETTGLTFSINCRNGQGDRLVGMVFSIKEGEAFYFPVHHKSIPNICTESNEYATINKYFKEILETKDIMMHNSVFDMKVMLNYDILVNVKEDTQLLIQLTEHAKDPSYPVKLKELTRLILGRDSYELPDLVANKKWGDAINFADLPYEYVVLYACPDTDNLLGLYHYFKQSCLYERYNIQQAYEIEIKYARVVAYSEYYGMVIDMDRVPDLSKELHEITARELKAIYDLVGYEFNVNSSGQLGKALFEDLGYPIVSYTSSGTYSCDKKALDKLASAEDADGNPLYPAAKHVKTYRDANKLITNFVDYLKADVQSKKNLNISVDGLITSNVKQILNTGRVSVSSPNYQSFNDTVKRYIIPRQGYYMMDADYSSVEYRITASMSGQEELISQFFDPDTDYHKLKASLMHNVPYELVTPEMRRQTKCVNFGLPYGMSDKALADTIFHDTSPQSIKKAAVLREKYFQGQEKVREFFYRGRWEAWNLGETRTFFNRPRFYDTVNNSQDKVERLGGNHKIQGTAADIYKMAMSRLYDKIIEKGWFGKVLISGFIHDEVLLEVSTEINPAIVVKELRNAMMLEIEGWCPLYTGMGIGSNWDDAKHIEMPTQVQEMIANTYGETGFPWWKGDCEELYANIEKMIYDYKRDRIFDYLKNPENKNGIFKSVENDLCHDVVNGVLSGHYKDCKHPELAKKEKDTLKNLYLFCEMYDCVDLYEEANLHEIDHGPEQPTDRQFNRMKPEDFENFDKEGLNLYIKDGIENFGVIKADAADRVYVNYDRKGFFNVARQSLRDEGDFEVWLYHNDKSMKTKKRISSADYYSLQEAYIRAFSS